MTMQTNFKERYEAPAILAVELKMEGIVCGSKDGEAKRMIYGNAIEI